MTFAALLVTQKREKYKEFSNLFAKDTSSVSLWLTPSPTGEGASSAFSFAEAGAKEKAIKKKTPSRNFALCGARPTPPSARASL